VRFEVDVERASAGLFTGGFQGQDFGVLLTCVGVGSFANYVSARVRDHCADVGIGGGEAYTLPRQIQRAMKELLVGGVNRHSGRIYHDATAADRRACSPIPRRDPAGWNILAGAALTRARTGECGIDYFGVSTK
jgi:hypothetical protein